MTGNWKRAICLAGWLPLGTIAICAGLAPANSVDEDAAPPAPPVAYRRIFVPAHDPTAWPSNEAKLLPIEARDLEAWIEAANRAAAGPGSGGPAAAVIDEAVYFARLEGGQLVDARGEWTVQVRTAGPAFLPLGESSLVIRQPRWRGAAKQPARLGAWGRNGGPANAFGLEAPASGTLEFAWQAPQRAVQGAIEVPLRLPPATSTRLILDLPDGMEPLLDGGVVTEMDITTPADAADSRPRDEEGPLWRRWEVAVGPAVQATLQIESVRRFNAESVDRGAPTDDEADAAREPPAADYDSPPVHEDFDYHFTQRGLDVSATWRFQGPIAVRRRLVVPLPPSVQLVSVSADGRALSWRVVAGGAPDAAQAVIQLPAESASRPTTVVLRAWHELRPGQPWQLPRMRPNDVAWASGTATLLFDAGLELRGIVPADYHQTGVTLSDRSGDRAETHSFAAYSPDACLEALIGRRALDAAVRLGSTLTVGDPGIAGRLVTQLDAARGDVHALSGTIGPGWTVDAVETVPADALREWYVDWSGGRPHLVVQLARAARPAQPVKVIVAGRLARLRINDPLSADTLGMLAWRNVAVARNLLSLRLGPATEIERIGTIPIVAPEQWSEDDRRLFDGTPEGQLFDLARVSPDAALRLANLPSPDFEPVAAGADRSSVVPGPARPDRRTENIPAPSRDSVGMVVAGRLVLESYFGTGGVAAHRAKYRLENRGAANVRVRLAGGAVLDWAELNGSPVAHIDRSDPNWAAIPLPTGERQMTLSLSISSSQTPLHGGGQLRPPLDDGELIPLAGEWVIWLPDEFAVAGHGVAEELGWRKRLFGPLARDTAPATVALRTNSAPPTYDISTSPAVPASAAPQLQRGSPPVTAASLAGWRSYTAPFVARGPRPVVVTHPPAATAGAAALFLLTAIGGAWLRRQRREWFILLVATAAGLCLALPVFLAPLATGGFLGLLFSLIAPWPRRDFSDENSTRTWHAHSAAGAAGVAWVVCLAILAGATPAAAAAQQPETIHTVLIPVDADGNVAGSRVYVSEAFLEQLLRDADDEPISGGWLLRDAAYHAVLPERSDGPADRGGGSRWTMELDIEVLARNVELELPLVRAEAEWLAASLDGIPVQMNWRDGGRGCTIAVSEPGRYELTISFAPRIRTANWRNHVELTLPPWPGAKLQIDHPASLTGLVFAGAAAEVGLPGAEALPAGRIPQSAGRNGSASISTIAKLDASGRLAVHWPTRDDLVADGARLRVVEMRWLQIDERGAVLAAKYIVNDARRPAALTLLADRRWELIADDNYSASVERESNSSGLQSVRVPLPADDPNRGEAVVRFRLAGEPAKDPLVASGLLGELRLPQIELASLSVDERWLAVSSDAAFECTIAGPATPAAGAVDDFVAAWGGGVVAQGDGRAPGAAGGERIASGEGTAESTPPASGPARFPRPQIAVLASGAASPNWRVDVRPRRVESSIDELLLVAVGRDSLRVQFQADIVPGSSHLYQLRLAAPPDLTIDQFAVTSEGAPVPIRSTRQDNGQFQVFFGEKITAPYRLVLNGRMPISTPGTVVLPHVAVAGRDAPSTRVMLYREEGALVELQGAAKPVVVPTGSPLPSWLVRPVGEYQIDRDAIGQARLAVRPNELELTGETLTELTREDGRWWATFHCRLMVERGVCDALRLRVPVDWAGPFDVSPATAVELTPRGEEQAVLTVRLPSSVPAGRIVELTIRGPLLPAAADAIIVPRIASEAAADWRSYIVVPAMLDGRLAHWTISGARPAATPPSLRPVRPADPAGSLAESTSLSLRATDPSFRVALARSANEKTVAVVQMADTIAIEGITGERLTATQFVLAPAGLSECQLELPPGEQLVSVRVGIRPTDVRALQDGRWTVTLERSPLPTIVEINTRSFADESAGRRRELGRPILYAEGAALPVAMGFWSIGRPSRAGPATIVGATALTATDYAASCFRRLVGIVTATNPGAASAATFDAGEWLRAWAQRLDAARREAERSLAFHEGDPGTVQVARTASEEIAAASQRLDAWMPAHGAAATAPGEAHSDATLDGVRPAFSADRFFSWNHWEADGAVNRLAIESAPGPATTDSVRAAGVMIVFVLTGAALWLAQRPAACDLLWRWPQVVGVLLGLAYWAWLRPPWLGWLIVAASLLLLLWPGWPAHSQRAESTTVLRVRRPK